MTSGQDRRAARRTEAARRAAKRRHPASGQAQPDRPGMLRAVPAQPDRQLPAEATDPTMKENTMPDPANPTADDHRTQLRTLLAQADYAAALEEIARDDPHRLLDVARQMVTWHPQLAAVLLGVVGTPEADRGVMIAEALTTMVEGAALTQADPISPWEHAARLFDPQVPGRDEAYALTEETSVTSSGHWHVIAVQDHGTGREWWTIRTNQYDCSEAEQQARQLRTERPDDQAGGDDPWDDQPETSDGQPKPAWSAIWLTRCTNPSPREVPPPGLVWQLPPPGDPWWTADGVVPRPPTRTGSVTLSTITPATPADLALLKLTPAELAELAAALDPSESQADA